jgi:hypothetical protein
MFLFSPPLNRGSNPVLISSPPELAGMSMETRLMTYDWKNDFHKFQSVTSRGAFRAVCKSAKSTMTPVSIHIYMDETKFSLLHYCMSFATSDWFTRDRRGWDNKIRDCTLLSPKHSAFVKVICQQMML